MQDHTAAVPCLYFISSADGILTEVNENLCYHLGYDQEELRGQKLDSIFTLATKIFQRTHFYPMLQMKGIADEIYITLRAKDGRDVPALVNAVRRDTGTTHELHFAGIAVKRRKKFEEELIAAKKAAERALSENSELRAAREQLQVHAEELDRQFAVVKEQNLELRQFNHIATHTLQEPLRKLLFYSSLIEDTADEEKARYARLKMRKAADDMFDKLKGLQQYVWLTNEDMQSSEVDLSVLINQVMVEMIDSNPEIAAEAEVGKIPVIEGNAEQLLILVRELISNAVRFRRGQEISIRIFSSTLLLNKFRQLAGMYKYTEFLKLEISDNGQGFDDTYQHQAFELFRKLHPSGGRGLGLALCRKIVENHGGSISIESKPEQGARVNVFLPLKQEQQPCHPSDRVMAGNITGNEP